MRYLAKVSLDVFRRFEDEIKIPFFNFKKFDLKNDKKFRLRNKQLCK